MGDPVGPESEWDELIWRFYEMCNDFDGWPVFYEVASENLHLASPDGLGLPRILTHLAIHIPGGLKGVIAK